MASTGSRQKVISLFKLLHRTSQRVFNEDHRAITAAREKIDTEFRKHAHEQDPQKVEELLKVAVEAEEALRTTVIQAKLDEKKGIYVANVTKDTQMEDNIPFDPNADIPVTRRRRRKTKCDDDKPS